MLLLLLLLMAFVPSCHRVRLARATDFLGCVERVDRGSGSVAPNISIRACRIPGQSSQCLFYSASPHIGHLGSTEASSRCLYASRCMLCPDPSCASSVASFLESITATGKVTETATFRRPLVKSQSSSSRMRVMNQ